jgi:transketolase
LFCSWNAIVVNGHDVNELLAAFKVASETKDKPTCLIAKTFKGNGLKGIENELDWHGKPLGDKATDLLATLRSLVNEETLVRPAIPKITAKVAEIKNEKEIKLLPPPAYDAKKEVATRLAHGTALEKLAKTCEHVIALDADTKNSTYSIKFRVRTRSMLTCCSLRTLTSKTRTIGHGRVLFMLTCLGCCTETIR